MATKDQARLYEALGEVLHGRLGEEPVEVEEMRARLEAVKAMEVAAVYLGLPEGKAPTTQEYQQAARETELPLTFGAVYGAFEKRWVLAKDFYEGEKIPPTASQRATKRAALGTERAHEEPIECVRQFLEQDPPPKSTGLVDYEAWAKEEQARRGQDEPRLGLSADGMRATLRTSWDRVLAVARGELTLEDAQEERLVEVLDESGEYIGITVAGWLLGMSAPTVNKYRSRSDFPPHVARVDGDRVWRRADIEAYRDGQCEWTHQEGCLDEELVSSAQIQELTGLSRDQVRSRVYEERWDRVPKPAGKVARRLYWLRVDVESWESAQ